MRRYRGWAALPLTLALAGALCPSPAAARAPALRPRSAAALPPALPAPPAARPPFLPARPAAVRPPFLPAAPAAARPPDRTAHAPAAPVPVSDGARCDLVREGSTAVATCLNPDPVTTRLQLHVACGRWWDPATDTAPVDDGPAQWVRLTGRCWKEIGDTWLTRATLR